MTNPCRFIVHTATALLLVVLFVCCDASAQADRSNIAGQSMAGAAVAASRGLGAVGINPANLALPHRGNGLESRTETVTHDSSVAMRDTTGGEATKVIAVRHDTLITETERPPHASFTVIPAFSFGARSDFIDYDTYESFFTGVDTGGEKRIGRFLNTGDKNTILNVFPNGIAETYLLADLRVFGLTIHNDFLGDIALTWKERIAANMDLSKDYMRMVFFGLDSAGSTYDFSGTGVEAWYLREYALSYARMLPMVKFVKDFSAGISLKLIQGFAAVTTDHYNATFGNTPLPGGGYALNGNMDFKLLRSMSESFPDSGNFDFTPTPTPAGKGFGFDFGVSGEVYEGVRAAFSITDIGSVTWDGKTKQTTGSATFSMTNPTSSAQWDTLQNAFKGKDTATDAFSMPLATSMRIGATLQVDELPFMGNKFPGRMVLAIEYQQGFNHSPGNTTRPRVALGTEWRPVRWFPLRSGISIGGINRFNWAAGFGLDFSGFNLNLGTENFGMLFYPSSYNQLSLGLEMIFRL